MIDFLLFVLILLIAGAGFLVGLHVGATYGTISAWFESIGKRIAEANRKE